MTQRITVSIMLILALIAAIVVLHWPSVDDHRLWHWVSLINATNFATLAIDTHVRDPTRRSRVASYAFFVISNIFGFLLYRHFGVDVVLAGFGLAAALAGLALVYIDPAALHTR